MKSIDKNRNLECPEDICSKGKRAWKVISGFLEESDLTYTGGCKTFYSPKEWRERGEDHGRQSLLVLVYDGGDVYSIFNPDDYNWDYESKLADKLIKYGLYIEQCTNWYSAVYRA